MALKQTHTHTQLSIQMRWWPEIYLELSDLGTETATVKNLIRSLLFYSGRLMCTQLHNIRRYKNSLFCVFFALVSFYHSFSLSICVCIFFSLTFARYYISLWKWTNMFHHMMIMKVFRTTTCHLLFNFSTALMLFAAVAFFSLHLNTLMQQSRI